MAIIHATIKAPSDKLFAVADWNANHTIQAGTILVSHLNIQGNTDPFLLNFNVSKDNVGIGFDMSLAEVNNRKFVVEKVVSTGVQTDSTAITGWLRETITGNVQDYGVAIISNTKINILTGITDTGYKIGHLSFALRNNIDVGTDDSGTLSNQYGEIIQFGHYDTNASATPQTTNVYGMKLAPYYKTGTITNLYSLYIDTPAIGGTCTNFYAILAQNGTCVFNESGSATSNYRIEGDTQTHLFYVKASVDNVGFGTDDPLARVQINQTGVGAVPSKATANLSLIDTSAVGAGTGGAIYFSAYYTGTSIATTGAFIKASKTTITDGEYGFDMEIGTRAHAVASSTKLFVTGLGSTIIGEKVALATNATNGFLYIPSCAGTPTGVPTAFTGKVAMVFDTANSKLYCYNGGWVDVT